MIYFVTGVAGFIGSFTAQALLKEGHTVIGLDSVNDYYRTDLKEDRLTLLSALPEVSKNTGKWIFYRGRLEDAELIQGIFAKYSPDRVIHLAAQAGVRYSLENPRVYTSSNIDGFLNILEACRTWKTPHLVYASSSSVYGMNRRVPFCESDSVDHPISLYAATKRANELMAHTYSHLYSLPVTGMRFFTVYGPMGRPDMAYFKFADAIMKGEAIEVYNNGDLLRDFTYIDDVVKAVCLIAKRPALPDINFDPTHPVLDRSSAPYRIYNIGNSNPEKLEDFISILEKNLGLRAEKKYLPMQAGDVYMTAANTSSLERDFGWKPSTPLSDGIARFTQWYKERKPWQQLQ